MTSCHVTKNLQIYCLDGGWGGLAELYEYGIDMIRFVFQNISDNSKEKPLKCRESETKDKEERDQLHVS